MGKTLREIVSEHEELHLINITKPDRHDRLTWYFDVSDKTSRLYGKHDNLYNYEYRIVTLRYGDDFFLAYKFFFDENTYEYLVDIRKSNHRTSVYKFIDGIIDYQVYSNDISVNKNDSSFKLTDKEMKANGIYNFVEMCYQYKEYSAIGIGRTRNVRNMVVLDIDVDCDKKENKKELHDTLMLFAQNNILPDFEIHNNTNGHVQLQWLIQSLNYKNVSKKLKSELISSLFKDNDKNHEVDVFNYSLLEETDNCIEYRLFARALTDISAISKFGDKNFTFWKAKNFCTALYRLHNLELKMPQYKGGDITYLSQEEMVDLFSTRDDRALYYEEAPYFQQLKDYSDGIIRKYIELEKERINDIKFDDFSDDTYDKRITYKKCNGNESRNSFVLNTTRNMTWEVCRKSGLHSLDSVMKLDTKEYNKLKNKVLRLVKKAFNEKDVEYNHNWPGTTNPTPYTDSEFKTTFNAAFDYAKCNIVSKETYSDESRMKSIDERCLKKAMRFILVDYVRMTNKNIKRNELHDNVKKILEDSNQKNISLSTLKRYIEISKSLTQEDRCDIYNVFYDKFKTRESVYNNSSEDCKTMNKKKLDYISINIIEDIMNSIRE